jgi:hypothetical protein
MDNRHVDTRKYNPLPFRALYKNFERRMFHPTKIPQPLFMTFHILSTSRRSEPSFPQVLGHLLLEMTLDDDVLRPIIDDSMLCVQVQPLPQRIPQCL